MKNPNNCFEKLKANLGSRGHYHELEEALKQIHRQKPPSDVFNALIERFASPSALWGGKYNEFSFLPEDITSVIYESIIAKVNINLSDEEFKKVMRSGGFINILGDKNQLSIPIPDITDGIWKYKNIQNYLKSKLEKQKYIDLAIKKIFTNLTPEYPIKNLIKGCIEIVIFCPNDKKQYTLDKITENLEKRYLLQNQRPNNFFESIKILLNQYERNNIQPKCSFWQEIKNEVNSQINTNFQEKLNITEIKNLKKYFEFINSKNINIFNLLEVQWTDVATENFFKLYAPWIKNQVNILESISYQDSTESIVNKYHCMAAISSHLEDVLSLYEKIINKTNIPQTIKKVFSKYVAEIIPSEVIDNLTVNLTKNNYLGKPGVIDGILNSLSQIKKIKMHTDLLNESDNGLNYSRVNTKKQKL